MKTIFDLTIFSIFRTSESYLDRYHKQVLEAFYINGGKCHAVWLEGDSEDQTFTKLAEAKTLFESYGHTVTIIKFDLKGPHWPAINHIYRWQQLSACWNKCLEYKQLTKIAICVESDLIWDPKIIKSLISKLDASHHVIYPMLMDEKKSDSTEELTFMDIWGFSRGDQKFSKTFPYWATDHNLIEEEELLEIQTGGGMIVTTYPYLQTASWDPSCCILKFGNKSKLFMDKTLKIYHPRPIKKTLLKKLNIIFKDPKILYAKMLSIVR
ncbi:MAG: hypothetical protein NTX49_02600 [Chlamydiae bacterium]|nr:hypothetical protein [Chlamydiota bacterium]